MRGASYRTDRYAAVLSGCLIAGVVIAFAVISVVTSILQCSWRWSGADVESRWLPIVGCQVNTAQGWIPEERFRVIE